MNIADCPSCGGNVNVGPKPKMSQHFVCTTCKTELEVTWLEPIELDFLVDDDFDDDDEEYDDDD